MSSPPRTMFDFQRPSSLLPPPQRAEFASLSRLLSCLVTESLVQTHYLPLKGFRSSGFVVLLKGNVSKDKHIYDTSDILSIVPLRYPPIFSHDGKDPRGAKVGLLDPLDMMPMAFEFTTTAPMDASHEHATLVYAMFTELSARGWNVNKLTPVALVDGPLSIWETFGRSIGLEDELLKDISYELESSVKWQKYSYEYPPKAPQFTSPSIDWEQSIVEAHPTHPMFKTRRFLPPIPDMSPGEYDLYHPILRFVSFPKEQLKVTYDFEVLTQPLLNYASRQAGKELVKEENHLIVPVHELQLYHIQGKFPEARIYPAEFNVPLSAQQSIRSVIVPNVYQELSLKLGVGIKLTSAVRTISPESAYFGPRFSAQVVPVLDMDPEFVTVARELASVVHTNPDGEVAKHCSAIVREAFELSSEERGERLIVCTALVESGHSGKDGHLPAVVRIFELDTEEKRLEWLDKFVQVFFKAFLPPMMKNGVAFECHPQNCVARFDIKSKELKGFIIRDFGGIRVHPGTLYTTTGVKMDYVEGHSIIGSTMDDVYTRMYHTIIHNHFQQLIRVLQLHYNGRGWSLVRQRLKDFIPRDHPLYDCWLSPERKTFPGKCFLRMRVLGMYRFHLHSPFPNLIHYEGIEMEEPTQPHSWFKTFESCMLM
ncbi:IucC family-domain-containing protein [Cyathus striatus]|nr:IucC family-domain-containing protein [Cyathus striatus]